MKGITFEAVSLIQQTVTRELKVIHEKRFLRHSLCCISDVNVLPKEVGNILHNGINKFFLCALYDIYLET
jgi:hypothetical protein